MILKEIVQECSIAFLSDENITDEIVLGKYEEKSFSNKRK